MEKEFEWETHKKIVNCHTTHMHPYFHKFIIFGAPHNFVQKLIIINLKELKLQYTLLN